MTSQLLCGDFIMDWFRFRATLRATHTQTLSASHQLYIANTGGLAASGVTWHFSLWEPSWQSENRWRVEEELFSLIVAWWRSSITQNTDHFCKARTSLKLSGKSWCCVYCADKVATGTLSQLTMDNGNEELETQATPTLRQNTLHTRSP